MVKNFWVLMDAILYWQTIDEKEFFKSVQLTFILLNEKIPPAIFNVFLW